MANTVFQIKRTSIAGRAANSTTLPNAGELAINLLDQRMYSTNGTVIFEIGANATSYKAGNTTNFVTANSTGVFPTSNTLATALGSTTSRWVLTANSADFSGKVVTVASSTTEAGFTLPHGTAPSVPANGDVWSTTTNFHARINGTTYSFAFLNGTSTFTGAKTFATTLTSNVEIVPTSNTVGMNLGSTVARFNLYANTVDTNTLLAGNTTSYWIANTFFLGPLSNTGFQFGSNANRPSIFATTGNFSQSLTSNGGVYPTSNTVGTDLGATILRFNLSANTITTSGSLSPVSNTVGMDFGTTTARWNITANTLTMSGNLTVSGTTLTAPGFTSNTTVFNVTSTVITPADIHNVLAPDWVANVNPIVQLHSTTADKTSIGFYRYNTATGRPSQLIFSRSRGAASNTFANLVSGDDIGHIIFNGANSTAFNKGAYIRAEADGTIIGTSNSTPTKIIFAGSANADTTTVTNYMAIAANGNVGIGTLTPDTMLHVAGTAKITGGLNANSSLGTQGQVLTSNGTAVFWRGIVNSASTSGSSISVGTTAPATPAVGDLWVDTN